MYINLNVNPLHRRADDCTVRAIATALNMPWEEVYKDICVEGLKQYDMPSANHVWGTYLKKKGFRRRIIPDNFPSCYSVGDFARDNPNGTYILALSGHITCVISGNLYDTWDSSDRIVIYYWEREE